MYRMAGKVAMIEVGMASPATKAGRKLRILDAKKIMVTTMATPVTLSSVSVSPTTKVAATVPAMAATASSLPPARDCR